MDPKKLRYLLFDSRCGQCTDLAAQIERATGGRLRAMSLYSRQAALWLDQASVGWRFEPTLLEVSAGRIRAYTGLAMRARLAVSLSPMRLGKLVRVVRRAEVPVFGRLDPHPRAPEPAGGQPAAGPRAGAPASRPAAAAGEDLEIGGPAPLESVTTVSGTKVSFSGHPDGDILIFMSTSCPHCERVAEQLAAFAEGRQERVVLVFGDADAGLLRPFLDRFNLLELPIALSSAARSAFGVTGVPYGFALDGSCVVRGMGIVTGRGDLDLLANTLYLSAATIREALAYRAEGGGTGSR